MLRYKKYLNFDVNVLKRALFVCLDINECIEELDNCHMDATCTNLNSTFQCTCNTGYEGNGTNCLG